VFKGVKPRQIKVESSGGKLLEAVTEVGWFRIQLAKLRGVRRQGHHRAIEEPTGLKGPYSCPVCQQLGDAIYRTGRGNDWV
jgi:hypothetical protein